MKRLLVTGASGFLGWNLCAQARGSWQVFGVTCSHAVEIPGVATLSCDLTRSRDLRDLFVDLKPDAVIHAAAESRTDYCQRHPTETHRINLEAAVNLAGLCADAAVPCAFTSTDLVFDGTKPPYKEDDPVAPICVYGEQKAAAERGMQARHPGCVVCRLPLMFGDPGPVASNFVPAWIAALQKGETLRLFVDEIRTPVSGRTAAAGLLMALEKGRGVLHLGGRDRISRRDCGGLLAEMLGADLTLITPARQKDAETPAPRPPDVSLDSARAFALGYDPPPIREALRDVLQALGHRGGARAES
jgi:dTDP-4-dehydrorhamnose reductase